MRLKIVVALYILFGGLCVLTSRILPEQQILIFKIWYLATAFI